MIIFLFFCLSSSLFLRCLAVWWATTAMETSEPGAHWIECILHITSVVYLD